jgi:hypothetical protein
MIMVAAAAVVESNSDSGGDNGNSNGWGGGVGSKGNSNGSSDNSNKGNNGGSCDSDDDDDGDDSRNDEDNGHDDNDMTVAAVRAAGATKTTTMTAMAGGTNNNQLKAQLCPAHNGDEDDMPGMCLAVVAVAAMSVWERGSATAMVEEVATAAAEEADNGRGGQRCAVYSFLVRLFFSPSPPLPLKAEAMGLLLSFLPQTLLNDYCLLCFHHCCHCHCW